MEKEKKTVEVVFILDRSGSMSGLEGDTIGGFNSMIEKQKLEQNGEVNVSVVLFNGESEVLYDRADIGQIEPMDRKQYYVCGNTALLDAVGGAIHHIGNIHKYAREEDRPEKTLFIITTDGMENASHKFNYREIKKLIEQQKEQCWEFIFLGANIDAVEVASHIGIDARRAVNYHADHKGTQEVFGAISNFAAGFAAPNIDFDKIFGDDSWRKDIDKDFEDRKK